jgi:hypothetical protein
LTDSQYYWKWTMGKHAIFIFTCNSSIKLSKIISEISLIEYNHIHVVDDSNLADIINENIALTAKCDSIIYLGIDAFNGFYKTKNLNHNSSKYLGTETWNLGTARNFAVDYSISMNFDKVLFVDDDISDINSDIVNSGFATLNRNNFVSCNLIGTDDDSIVGHISKKLGIIDTAPKMLSGGFWFLCPDSLNNKFYNIYNEDWIMQLLERNKERIVLPFSVRHNADAKNPLNERDLHFQEIGEIVIDGLMENNFAISMDSSFWNTVIENRIFYIKRLTDIAKCYNKTEEYHTLKHLGDWYNHLTGRSILKIINKQKYDREKYQV